MNVNDIEATGGCYIAGSHGQYGLDAVADVCQQFDIEFTKLADPRYWRTVYDDPEQFPEHKLRSEDIWENLVEASDKLEERLNDVTTGGYWSWEDGEFFLAQTEVEGFVYVPVEDGEDYDDAWRSLVDDGLGVALTNYDDVPKGQKAHTFVVTAHYEPEDQ